MVRRMHGCWVDLADWRQSERERSMVRAALGMICSSNSGAKFHLWYMKMVFCMFQKLFGLNKEAESLILLCPSIILTLMDSAASPSAPPPGPEPARC